MIASTPLMEGFSRVLALYHRSNLGDGLCRVWALGPGVHVVGRYLAERGQHSLDLVLDQASRPLVAVDPSLAPGLGQGAAALGLRVHENVAHTLSIDVALDAAAQLLDPAAWERATRIAPTLLYAAGGV